MEPEISQTVTFLQRFIIPLDIYKQVVVLRCSVISKHLRLQRVATCNEGRVQASARSGGALCSPRAQSPSARPAYPRSAETRKRKPVRGLILFSCSKLSPRTNINITFILTTAKLYKSSIRVFKICSRQGCFLW